MKIIIDTDKKELGAEDVITMGQLHEFLEKHGLLDYGLMGVKPDGPSVFPVKFAPNPLDPPWIITSGPITINHDHKSDFGYQFIDKLGVDPKSPRRIIGMREDDSRHIEPMTPEDAFQ